MNANKHELLLQKEVYAVVGCAIEVLNVRGHGLHEKVYENCLCVEFRLRGIPFTQQERHQVLYKGDHERGQMLNYLRITTLPVGIILNFKHARLEWERLVLSGERMLHGNKEELIL